MLGFVLSFLTIIITNLQIFGNFKATGDKCVSYIIFFLLGLSAFRNSDLAMLAEL